MHVRGKSDRPDCRVVAQALCVGDIPTTVRAVAGQAARHGKGHIMIRFGNLLFYLEDREALVSLAEAIKEAGTYADRVFSPVEDGFTRAEKRAREAFERSPLPAAQAMAAADGH